MRDLIEYKKQLVINKLDKEMLDNALEVNLYINDLRDLYWEIYCDEYTGVKSILLNNSNENLLLLLSNLRFSIRKGEIDEMEIPLIFIIIRDMESFKNILETFNIGFLKLITGFVFPRFNVADGEIYLKALNNLMCDRLIKIYGVPVVGGEDISSSDGWINESVGIRELLNAYKDIVLNLHYA